MESVLFIIVGIVTILSGGLMVWSKNAVHSALFLIVNFIGVAFLYLMLEAPFLALVQIAVYAGAIMVLFVFVIMLLGAEKTGVGIQLRRFPWLPPVGLGLAAFLVLIGFIAVSQGNIDSQVPAPRDATVRVVHAAPQMIAAGVAEEPEAEATEEALDGATGSTDDSTGTGETPEETTESAEEEAPAVPSRGAVAPLPEDRIFVLMLDGILLDDSFRFGENTGSVTVTPGVHTLELQAPDSGEVIRSVELTVGEGANQSVVIAGEFDIDFIVTEQPTTPSLTLVNALGEYDSVSLGDLQNELFNDSRVLIPLVENLPYGASTNVQMVAYRAPVVAETEGGEAVEATAIPATPEPVVETDPVLLQYPAGFPNWVVYQGGLPDDEISRRIDFINVDTATTGAASLFEQVTVLRLSDALALDANENTLVIVAPERRSDGSLRSVALKLAPVEVTAFGSPAALGERLFTDYVLPFQLVAILLLAAMVGVIVITYRGEHVPKPSRTTRRKVSRPLTSVIASQTGTDLTSGAPQLPERTETPAGD